MNKIEKKWRELVFKIIGPIFRGTLAYVQIQR